MIQKEHAEWLAQNFPNQSPEYPAAGMVEEAGELMHALLKCQQGHVWGVEARYRDTHWGVKMEDAVGDCAIFVCSLCNSNGWDFEQMLKVAEGDCMRLKEVSAFEAVAELIGVAVDQVQWPTEQTVAETYLTRLARLCEDWGLNLRHCVAVTWTEVKRRKRDASARPGGTAAVPGF